MRTPHRRDISARQDLLGRELRQLFEDYTQEEVPEELRKLALQLQSAVESRPAEAAPQAGSGAQAVPAAPGEADAPAAKVADKSARG